ncbi:hypothetical protein PROFUN_02864 [Planoprotostelium fungivorum]|uniref:CMP/dCMP-type deaminase domain-containing protein n=1 Tax=Planoprotostelium fungivorum TaxID=1890364 RepID=A0A2P6NRX9_9EUKA|nr:hypothetical protein PROFUN_02864 [Planoprotostelium fungivorum]
MSAEGSEESHIQYMREALSVAETSISREEVEVPIGCVFVRNGIIIGRAHNLVSETLNATRHAELVAIDAILENLQPKDEETVKKIFNETDLYVTCEPCIMCASALLHIGIRKVYFGCSNDRFGGCGTTISVHQEKSKNCPEGYEVVSGILKDEAVSIMKRFYAIGNKNGDT